MPHLHYNVAQFFQLASRTQQHVMSVNACVNDVQLNCSYKLTQVLNVPAAKSSAFWRHMTSRFEFHVTITVWVGISFIANKIVFLDMSTTSALHSLTVFNLSTTVCNSTNYLGADGYFWRRRRRIHSIALQLTVQLMPGLHLHRLVIFVASNYALCGDFVAQCWWLWFGDFGRFFQLINDLGRHRWKQRRRWHYAPIRAQCQRRPCIHWVQLQLTHANGRFSGTLLC